MKAFPLVLLLLATVVCSVAHAQDLPDKYMIDSNFDGIDGDIAQAVFVAPPPAGSPVNPGTMALPTSSIANAIVIAQSQNKTQILIAVGNYAEAATLNLPDGMGLYGGYSGPPAWSRSMTQSTISGPSPLILASGCNNPTYIQWLNLNNTSGYGPANSRVGIVANNSPGLIIQENFINTGSASAGFAGASGAPGAAGSNGSTGGGGQCDNGGAGGLGGSPGTSSCGRTGGQGGQGGAAGRNNGQPGAAGVGGTSGGPGGSWGDPGQSGTDGATGAAGANGTNGSGGSGFNLSGSLVFANGGGNGVTGAAGNGGGGGGGGGGQYCFFCNNGMGNGGGGGGGGGCPATGGTGGQGGGSVIGIIAVNSTGIIFDNNTIFTGSAGNGGNGGNGGVGGNGGTGGAGGAICTGEVGKGGNGGNGGKGGHGGSGGGGAGGLSVGIFLNGTTQVSIIRNNFNLGPAGAGGQGGFNGINQAPNGSPGVQAQIYPAVNPIVVATLTPAQSFVGQSLTGALRVGLVPQIGLPDTVSLNGTNMNYIGDSEYRSTFTSPADLGESSVTFSLTKNGIENTVYVPLEVQPLYLVNNRNVADIFESVLDKAQFGVWGRILSASSAEILISDGGPTVRIVKGDGSSLSRYQVGAFILAKGVLQLKGSPTVAVSSESDITVLSH